jgi:preprotein translocase subunit SecY
VIDSFRNIFAIPDLRKRVLFTFALLAVYRLGAFIPIPGIDPVAIAEFTKAARCRSCAGFRSVVSTTSSEFPTRWST